MTDDLDLRVAIIGMAGRFPGAETPEALWANLADGVESIRTLSRDELAAAGVPAAIAAAPGFVPAIGRLDDPDRWDATLFGVSPAEAAQLDPQHRVFLECAWQALEAAGYAAGTGLAAGVWAGTGFNSYLWLDPAQALRLLTSDAATAVIHGNDKDFLASRVAYKLDLRGPAVTVQTACSTSLVAVHAACQAILGGECELALAGGVSIRFPQAGHVFSDGAIFSPDGHCRAFDAGARGTVGGNGAGVVVLKRLSAALADGDPIRAVVLGSAINNDGRGKVGYTAPSVDGQVDVIRGAHAAAGVEPASISYIEAHGTGTTLGDAIELAALAQALGPRAAPCRIGSLKTNLGHLDVAAGVAGLIKTVLALEHRTLPPSLHFHAALPGALDATRIAVNHARVAWHAADGEPRRAGVSSFGIGGTNAHVVLEQAPARVAGGPARPLQILRLSAPTATALDAMAAQLADHLAAHGAASSTPGEASSTPGEASSPPGDAVALADVAWTLAVGRAQHRFRRAVVCADPAEAVARLRAGQGRDAFAATTDGRGRVVLVVPGQGTQAIGMARALYAAEPAYRAVIDECATRLQPLVGGDVRTWMFDGPPAGRSLDDTAIAQPVVFTAAYAVCRWWLALGIRPAAVIGHSLGELVAACVAGVFRLPDALAVVAERGRLMQAMAPGAMLAVRIADDALAALLPAEVELAAINAPDTCTVSGPVAAIDAFAAQLAARGVGCSRLRTSHAFHSAQMAPMLAAFERCVAGVARRAPALPVISNVTGDVLTVEAATSPAYWARQARQPVRFAAGVRRVLADGPAVFLEAGATPVLGRVIRGQLGAPGAGRVISEPGDPRGVARAIAQLWVAGVEIDLRAYHAGERRVRMALPTYPFERERYWLPSGATLDVAAGAVAAGGATGAVVRATQWTQRPLGRPVDQVPRVALRPDSLGVARLLHARLERAGCSVVVLPVDPGEALAALAPLRAIGDAGTRTDLIDLTGLALEPAADELAHALAFAAACPAPWRLQLATHGACAITSGAPRLVERAALPGALGGRALAAPVFRVIDLGGRRTARWPAWAAGILAAEVHAADASAPIVAHRGSERWVLALTDVVADDASAGDVGNALGRDARGSDARGSDARGRDARGNDARGSDARGSDAPVVFVDALSTSALTFAFALARRGQSLILVEERDTSEALAHQRRLLQDLAQRAGGQLEVVTAAAADGGPLVAAAQLLARATQPFAGLCLGLRAAVLRLDAPHAQPPMQTDPPNRARPDALRDLLHASLGAAQPGTRPDALRDLLHASVGAAQPGFYAVWWPASLGAGERGQLARRIAAVEDELGTAVACVDWGDAPLDADACGQLVGALASGRGGWLVSPAAVTAPAASTIGAWHQARPRPDVGPAHVAPASEPERLIAEMWQELLGITGLGVDDDFFALGGHSLMATQLAARLRATFNVVCSLDDVIRAGTIAGQARLIEHAILCQLLDEDAARGEPRP